MQQSSNHSTSPTSKARSGRARTPVVLQALLTLLVLGSVAAAAPADAPTTAQDATKVVDLNKSTEQQLTGLPGIGPAMAKRIVAFRKQHGPFRRVEDLLKVKGIGEKSFQKLRPYLKVSRGA